MSEPVGRFTRRTGLNGGYGFELAAQSAGTYDRLAAKELTAYEVYRSCQNIEKQGHKAARLIGLADYIGPIPRRVAQKQATMNEAYINAIRFRPNWPLPASEGRGDYLMRDLGEKAPEVVKALGDALSKGFSEENKGRIGTAAERDKEGTVLRTVSFPW